MLAEAGMAPTTGGSWLDEQLAAPPAPSRRGRRSPGCGRGRSWTSLGERGFNHYVLALRVTWLARPPRRRAARAAAPRARALHVPRRPAPPSKRERDSFYLRAPPRLAVRRPRAALLRVPRADGAADAAQGVPGSSRAPTCPNPPTPAPPARRRRRAPPRRALACAASSWGATGGGVAASLARCRRSRPRRRREAHRAVCRATTTSAGRCLCAAAARG